MDNLFTINTLQSTTQPQTLIWLAMHQDYAEDMVSEPAERTKTPESETAAGKIIIKHLLAGNRGHYGCLEHPQITVNVGYFPHSTMQQLRTHRVGVSFDVQSFRYTSKRILDVADGKREVNSVFYLRPPGTYGDRSGKKYEYTEATRNQHLELCRETACLYAQEVRERGLSEEHARGLLRFDIRQHFVISMNVRSLMHLLDLRWKADAQLEAQWFSELLFERFQEWTPEIAAWYQEHRAKKARLAP